MPTLSRLETRMEKRIEKRLEAEVTQRVEAEVTQRLEAEVTQRVEAEVTQRVEAELTQKGLLKGRREDVLDNLAIRFNAVPEDIIQAVHQITDQAMLKNLHRAAVQVATLEEFRALL